MAVSQKVDWMTGSSTDSGEEKQGIYLAACGVLTQSTNGREQIEKSCQGEIQNVVKMERDWLFLGNQY